MLLPHEVAAGLYAAGYYLTRDDAEAAVIADPGAAYRTLEIYLQGAEMKHHDDRASIAEWGSCDPGTT